MKRWYNEYNTNIRIHDYFSIMINQFPVIVFRKIDSPHDSYDKGILCIGLFGFTFEIKLK